MINKLIGTPSSEQQINFGVLQIDTENFATGNACSINSYFFRKIKHHFYWYITSRHAGLYYTLIHIQKALSQQIILSATGHYTGSVPTMITPIFVAVRWLEYTTLSCADKKTYGLNVTGVYKYYIRKQHKLIKAR